MIALIMGLHGNQQVRSVAMLRRVSVIYFEIPRQLTHCSI